MPLTFTKKPKMQRWAGIGNKALRVLNYLQPANIFVILVIVAIILAFVKDPTGFYVVASIFIICYFGERISKILQLKRNDRNKQQQQKK